MIGDDRIVLRAWAQDDLGSLGKPRYDLTLQEMLEDYLKRVFSLRKVMLHVIVDNEGAVRFYLRLGFDEVGRMKDHFLNNGKYRDVLIMEKIFAQ